MVDAFAIWRTCLRALGKTSRNKISETLPASTSPHHPLAKERLTRSVRRVAGRYGPVARATLVCKRSWWERFVI